MNDIQFFDAPFEPGTVTIKFSPEELTLFQPGFNTDPARTPIQLKDGRWLFKYTTLLAVWAYFYTRPRRSTADLLWPILEESERLYERAKHERNEDPGPGEQVAYGALGRGLVLEPGPARFEDLNPGLPPFRINYIRR